MEDQGGHYFAEKNDGSIRMPVPSEPDKRGKHYAEKVWNLPPTKIQCICGAVFEGDDAIIQQQEHMRVQDLMTGLEQELERRNVFDQKNDKDEENP